jgi:hypothetical protein
VVFNIKGTAIKWRDNTVWLGSIVAPKAQVSLGENAFFKGTICAKQIELQTDVVAVYHGSSTSLPKLLANRGDEEEIAEISNLPAEFALAQNYPNPFNPITVIGYALSQPEQVEIVIYNTLGQKVKTLVSQRQKAGYYQATWDATNDAGYRVSSGIYFYLFKAGEYKVVKKMVLLE